MTVPEQHHPALPTAEAGPPAWFAAALAQVPERGITEVDGCPIHTRSWGRTSSPTLVLVHGGAAHSGWWDHVAPFFATTHRVVALDLSGHGDSGRRDRYDMTQWAREVLAVATAPGLRPAPVVVGHSMGGWVAATTGVEHGDRLAGVVILDSPLNDQPPEQKALEQRRRPLRVYATREEAVAKFRTLPAQRVVLPYVGAHIAQQSVREVQDGWTWKFDPTMFGQRRLMRELLPALRCPAALLRSEFGLVTATMAADMQELLGRGVPIVEVPDAGHHAMLDQPLPLVASLRTLFAVTASATPPLS